MELQTPMRFPATVLCWTQDSEVLKIEVSRSFAHNNPYLDFLQDANTDTEYPHMGFCSDDNSEMGKTTKENIADRLEYLMRVNPDLSTNQKIEDRSGVSKNTVRRLRMREEVDVSLANTEAVANAFGLSLAEFVSAPGQNNGLDADELVLIHKYRQLSQKKDKDEVLFFASSKAAIKKLQEDDLD